MALLNFPIGTIIAWGNAAVPADWHVCDGEGGTPNLINKFVRGASVDGDVRATGGVSSHVHGNPNTDTRSAHNHGGYKGGSVGGAGGTDATTGSGASAASTAHTHNGGITSDYANSHDHEIGDTASKSILPTHAKRVYIRRIS